MNFLRSTFWLLAAASAGAAWAAPRVVVEAAEFDRAGVVMTLAREKLPADAVGLQDAGGRSIAWQRDDQGNARFVLAWVRARTSPELVFVNGVPGAASGGVQVVTTQSQLRLAVDGADFFDYWMEVQPFPREGIKPAFARSGFIHPVRTPGGAVVTSSYPADHLHHHGIWSPWTKTRFQGRAPDFWNMGDGTGRVEFAGLDRTWSGPVHGGFQVRHRFMDLSAPEPMVALRETWEVTAYQLEGAAQPVRVFDLVITQTTATPDALELPEYRYGGLGLRGPEEWLGATQANFLTSEGETDRVKGNATRVRWHHMGGLVEGKLAGMAVLGHPDNFRAPQPVRIHPKEPYTCMTPSQLGDWAIEPGKPYVARYRFVIADGAPDGALLEAYWQGYAHPGKAFVRD